MTHPESNGHDVTRKGQRHDPNMFGAHYLEDGRRQRLVDNGLPIGSGPLGIEWPRER